MGIRVTPMGLVRTRVYCDPLLLEEWSPTLIYGEAAAGKTLAALATAAWYSRLKGGRIYLLTTEPQSTLPLASRLLPPDAFIYTAYNLEDLADELLEVTRIASPGDIIVVDTLTSPYRLEVGEDAQLANRLLSFAAALLTRASELGIPSIAVSQVHADPDSERLEPPGYNLIRDYFPLRVHLVKVNPGRRVGLDEDNNVIFELIVGSEGVVEIRCTQRYSSSSSISRPS